MATRGMVGDLPEATAATVATLRAGISAPMSNITDGTTYASTDRAAAYDVGDSAIAVSIGNGNDTPTEVSATLSGDKKATVEAVHCRSGRSHADISDRDMYEAMAYSSVEAPKQGKKFGSGAASDTCSRTKRSLSIRLRQQSKRE